MLSIIKSKRFLTSLLFAVFSFCVTFLYNLTPLMQYDSEALEYLMLTTSNEILPVLISSSTIVCIVTFLCYYIGDKFREKLELNTNKIDKKSWFFILGVGVVVPILIGLSDTLLKLGETFISVSYSLLNVSSSVLYFGVLEEVWYRFAFLPLIVYAFYKVFNREKKEEKVDKKYYTIGLIFTTLFLFVFEFNKIVSLHYLSILLVVRMILVYLVPNYIYGHLYLKYNLKAAILAHSIFMVMHLGIVPFVFTLF